MCGRHTGVPRPGPSPKAERDHSLHTPVGHGKHTIVPDRHAFKVQVVETFAELGLHRGM